MDDNDDLPPIYLLLLTTLVLYLPPWPWYHPWMEYSKIFPPQRLWSENLTLRQMQKSIRWLGRPVIDVVFVKRRGCLFGWLGLIWEKGRESLDWLSLMLRLWDWDFQNWVYVPSLLIGGGGLELGLFFNNMDTGSGVLAVMFYFFCCCFECCGFQLHWFLLLMSLLPHFEPCVWRWFALSIRLWGRLLKEFIPTRCQDEDVLWILFWILNTVFLGSTPID